MAEEYAAVDQPTNARGWTHDCAKLCALVAPNRNYRKATELDPRQALSWLGLGWVLEETSTLEEPFATPDEGPSEPLGGADRARIQGLLVRLGGGQLADRDAAAEALTREL